MQTQLHERIFAILCGDDFYHPRLRGLHCRLWGWASLAGLSTAGGPPQKTGLATDTSAYVKDPPASYIIFSYEASEIRSSA